MLNFTSKTKYFISSNPTDMRNGREGLAGIVREVIGHNPKCYDEAQIAELLASKDWQIADQAALIESQKKDITRIAADRDQEREGRIKAEEEKKAVVIELNQLRQEHDEKMKEMQPAKDRIELSNSAAERMFRHIAMGRRNWLHSGSHDAAQNIAFMYSLYESCKLNDLNFFNYIEDVLTRLMKGETDYKSLIPCNYVPLPSEEEQKEVA